VCHLGCLNVKLLLPIINLLMMVSSCYNLSFFVFTFHQSNRTPWRFTSNFLVIAVMLFYRCPSPILFVTTVVLIINFRASPVWIISFQVCRDGIGSGSESSTEIGPIANESAHQAARVASLFTYSSPEGCYVPTLKRLCRRKVFQSEWKEVNLITSLNCF